MQEFRTEVETKLPEIPTGADSKLSQQAWVPQLIAEGKSGSTPAEKKDAAKEVPAKVKDAFVERAQINDRCALDVYEHHWELTMPKVTIPIQRNGWKINSELKLEEDITVGKEKLTSEKLTMNDQGHWMYMDDSGLSVDVVKQKTKPLILDAKHPEIKTTVRQIDFANGVTVSVETNGRMTFVRHQDHVFMSPEGTKEFEKEKIENTFAVIFDKKTGVTNILDQGKQYNITRDGDKP